MRASSLSVPSRRAFTLIELLAVLAIVAILAAILIGAGRGAAEAGRRGRAKAELAAIAAALESYKRELGDYPRTASAADMLQALLGRRSPTGATIRTNLFLGLARFRTREDRDPFADPGAELADPWNRPYRYVYQNGDAPAWLQPGFVLYSTGPDGADRPPPTDTGRVDAFSPENADNLYANP
ncbi:MAG TPA: type II secretion system protein GspG [Opitutus sp.]|nr:type II secretion system protein GspG [Opitutus sp.]